ncbi:capsular polysaccharide synthesis protein [[Clostridium] fimetarium]|uniref:Capsular polysaccharide synthesis protein n=1 Tax=[Clostridium] fimetarium TaxID=99656 RepID=A0A1I0RNA7_9FIRM|nr:capsular polysaccharide synthesis protein [[Clostridium] fimetarium]SEW42705.1 Capsular polysaccharide synthesis protein [[Clostridium] fimetarium]
MLNEFYQNIGMKGYFDRYGVVNAIKRGMFVGNPVHIIKDYEIKKVLWQKYASKRIRKYLKFQDTDPQGLSFNDDFKVENPIWIFWNTGMEKAPKIVKKCYKTVLMYGGRPVIVLDENNIDEYITFPKYIVNKTLSGNIPMAGYTDLMRFALLEHYGGTWIDSTVLLSAPISDVILDCNFFALQNSMCLVNNPVLFAVWFLHAKSRDKTIRQIRNVAFAYWTKEECVIEYLLSNLIINEIITGTEIEKKIPYMNTDYSEYLIRCLGEDYDEAKLNWIFGLTNIHKLTYKLDKSISETNTMYNFIMNE